MEDVVHVARRVPNMGTVQQAAELYGLSPRRLCKVGKVRYVNCGNRWLVNLDSLARYFEQGEELTEQADEAPVYGIRRIVAR